MKSKTRFSHLCALSLAVFVLGATSATTQSGPTPEPASDDNAELKTLFLDDQHDRGVDPFPEFDEHGKPVAARKSWPIQPMEKVEKYDRERRVRVHQLLDAGNVKTGQDYWFAAMIFQHGEKPRDYLLAHVLALTAAYKGNRNGRWLAAATLDRYLLSISQKQIYGTQFTGKTGETVQADYDADALDDRLRATSCVIPREVQHKLWLAFQSGQSADANTTLISCLMGAD
jgi:hypothetical protein